LDKERVRESVSYKQSFFVTTKISRECHSTYITVPNEPILFFFVSYCFHNTCLHLSSNSFMSAVSTVGILVQEDEQGAITSQIVYTLFSVGARPVASGKGEFSNGEDVHTTSFFLIFKLKSVETFLFPSNHLSFVYLSMARNLTECLVSFDSCLVVTNY